MKNALLFFVLIFCLPLMAATGFKLYPPGEKKFKTSPLPKNEINLHMAQLETSFFIIELDDAHDFKKHSPLFEVITDSEAPFDVELYWLLGHGSGKDFVEDIVVPTSQEGLYLLPKENFPVKKLLLVEIRGKLLSVKKKWEGHLKLTRLDTKKEIDIPMKVELHKFVLPAQFQMKTSFGFAPWTVYRKHNSTASQEDELYRAYFKEAREHRTDLHKIYIEFSKKEDSLLGGAQNPTHSFWSIWNEARGKDESYGRMQLTDLPVPTEMKKNDSSSEKFWRQLDREVKGQTNFFVYFEDEPTPEQIKDMIPTLKKIKTWAPNVRLMLTAHWTKELDGLIDIWCPNLINWNVPQFPSQKKYDELKAKGNELWVYVSCNSHGCKKNEATGLPDLIIERNASTLYSFPWVAEAVGATGILYYDTVRGYMESDRSPWNDPKIYNGLGEGNLFYPCPKTVCGSKPVVFPSLRLKILRSSLEALEVIKTAQTKEKKFKSLRENIAKSLHYWSKRIIEYEELKRKALEYLDAN